MNAPDFSSSRARMAGRWRRPSPVPGVLVLLAFLPMLLGFAHAKIGDVIENAELPTLGEGNPVSFLSGTNVSVFVFFNPEKPNSRAALRQLADLRGRLKDRPVHWVVIVSDRLAPEVVREEVRAAGLHVPVLVDEGDALFGRLGVALYPVVGITDTGQRLRHYLPFHKVNYEVLIEAAVRHTLGEIDDAALDRARHPQTPPMDRNNHWRTHTRLNLARRMLEKGKPAAALKLVETCLKQEPDYLDALLLKGRLLALTGRIEEARATYARVLQITTRPPAETAETAAPPSAEEASPAPAEDEAGMADKDQVGGATKDATNCEPGESPGEAEGKPDSASQATPRAE